MACLNQFYVIKQIYIFTATINNLNKHVVDILVMKKWGMNYLVIQ